VPARLHLYNATFHLRYHVPVRSVLILLRPKADAADQAVRLVTAAFILTGLRVKKGQLPSIYEGVRVMHESTAYDEALEEGEIRHGHRVLLHLGRKLLGTPDPSIESTLNSVQDVEQLDRMTEAILSVKSWQQLLSTP
jgi:hypothetical protein